MQGKDAEHADDDRREHHLDHGEVLKQEHAEQDVIFCNAAFLEQKAKDDSKESSPTLVDLLSSLTHWPSPSASVIFGNLSNPEHQHRGRDTGDKKADHRDPGAH